MQHNWEIHAQTREAALSFLAANEIVPDTVYIDEDGWVEAIYDYPAGDDSLMKTWEKISESTDMRMFKPMLMVRNKSGMATLSVQFQPHTPTTSSTTGPESDDRPSLWQRLKKLVS